MQVIYKYDVLIGVFELKLPIGARILKVDSQHYKNQMWVLHRHPRFPSSEPIVDEVRVFEVFGTGHLIDNTGLDKLEFVATWQQDQFVWHLFEEKR